MALVVAALVVAGATATAGGRIHFGQTRYLPTEFTPPQIQNNWGMITAVPAAPVFEKVEIGTTLTAYGVTVSSPSAGARFVVTRRTLRGWVRNLKSFHQREQYAARALLTASGAAAIGALTDALPTADPRHQTLIMEVLAGSDSDEANAALASLAVTTRQSVVYQRAVAALRRSRHSSAERLVRFALCPVTPTRSQAWRVMRDLGDTRCVPLLIEALAEARTAPDAQPRAAAAAEALAMLTGADPESTPEAWRTWWHAHARTFRLSR